MRMVGEKLDLLNRLFKVCSDWDQFTKLAIAHEIGMSPLQVAKWNWDQRRR